MCPEHTGCAGLISGWDCALLFKSLCVPRAPVPSDTVERRSMAVSSAVCAARLHSSFYPISGEAKDHELGKPGTPGELVASG